MMDGGCGDGNLSESMCGPSAMEFRICSSAPDIWEIGRPETALPSTIWVTRVNVTRVKFLSQLPIPVILYLSVS